MTERPSVAIIGSFKQHYAGVLDAHRTFTDRSVTVTSPLGSEISRQADFVRFSTDPEAWDDPRVQTVALHRILRAAAVYVWAPDGYVGRTTCYEIGRIVHARQPIYFSAKPRDLPIYVPDGFVLSPADLAELLHNRNIQWLYDAEDELALLERQLVSGDFSDV